MKFDKSWSPKDALAHLRIIGLVYKEFKMLVRKKKAPLLVLLLPILLIVVYSAGTNALSNPQTVSIGICNNDPSASDLINSINGNFKVSIINSSECEFTLKEGVKSGKYIIGLSIPEGLMNSIRSGKQGVITYYVDDSKPLSSSMSGYLLDEGLSVYSKGVITTSEAELRSMASEAKSKLNSTLIILNTTSKVLNDNKLLFSIAYPLMNDYLSNAINELVKYDSDLTFVQGLSVQFLTKPIAFYHEPVYAGVNTSSFNFSSVFTIISLFTLLLLSSSGIIFDKRTGYLLRIKTTRTFISSYILSKIIFYFTISVAQLLLVMGLMSIQGAVFNFDLLTLIMTLMLISTLNTSIGMLIGSLSESDNVAILFSLTLSLPFLFLSGVFFPLEFMPDYIKLMANIVPLNSEINLLKQTSVMGLSLSQAEPLMINLLTMSIVLIAINYLIIKYRER